LPEAAISTGPDIVLMAPDKKPQGAICAKSYLSNAKIDHLSCPSLVKTE